MSLWLTAIILGIVEGLTEFLPVSSTGHLILATELLGYDASKWAIFNIAIQPGAILAIVVLYRKLFWDMFVGFFRRDPVAIAFVRNLLVAFIPAVVLGLAFGDYIETLLENAVVVAWALVIGGRIQFLPRASDADRRDGAATRQASRCHHLERHGPDRARRRRVVRRRLGGDQGVSGRGHPLWLRALRLVSNHRRRRGAHLAHHEIGPIFY
jgi:undecaprenyl pyrophosphate phosphatase UppP